MMPLGLMMYLTVPEFDIDIVIVIDQLEDGAKEPSENRFVSRRRSGILVAL